ncbi:hypothetical protein AVEN_68133-1 [Araneus ventricosus]|uniref:Uncharacterized protein n=1 Tax=Araneus ventricosus TaxID=182803 RepID=A0A4Y2W7J4_ARAVE|nr:hypothetical protein AVEN_35429-1 [Araneus ventricosus]GBO32882.1 hypothetical protein AVEN_68133-1 [Araneus ventricosus]
MDIIIHNIRMVDAPEVVLGDVPAVLRHGGNGRGPDRLVLGAGRPDRHLLVAARQGGRLPDNAGGVHSPDAGPVMGGPEHFLGFLGGRCHLRAGLVVVHGHVVVRSHVARIRQVVRIFGFPGSLHEEARTTHKRVHFLSGVIQVPDIALSFCRIVSRSQLPRTVADGVLNSPTSRPMQYIECVVCGGEDPETGLSRAATPLCSVVFRSRGVPTQESGSLTSYLPGHFFFLPLSLRLLEGRDASALCREKLSTMDFTFDIA